MRFPAVVIASTDDPFGSIEHAHARAEEWGSGIIEIGAFGHINGQSGLGDWPQGKYILKAFSAGCLRP
jgi:predicted alpha/beta hydrolase family esterase